MHQRRNGKSWVETKKQSDSASKAPSIKGRYSNRAEALSNGFQEIAKNRKDKRFHSNSLAQPRQSEGLPMQREKLDSQVQRYRKTIQQLEKL